MCKYKKITILVCVLLTAWNIVACGQVKENEAVNKDEFAASQQESNVQTVENIDSEIEEDETVSEEESAVNEQENSEQVVENTNPETTISANDSYYSIATDISSTEVENYAAHVKQSFMEHDWLSISAEISYPITISGTMYSDSAAFLDASNNFDSNLDEEFFAYLEEEDCVEMFHDLQGIMLGETGQVWIAEVLDDEFNSQGLKIIAINGLLKE